MATIGQLHARLALNGEGNAGHRQYLSAGTQQCSGPLQAGNGVPQKLPQCDDEQVAHGVVVQRAALRRTRFKAVLHDIAPGPAPVGVITQGAQGHPQVSGREDAVLIAETPGTAAVVRHCDDCRQLRGEQTQGRQRRREAMTAAQGHHGGALLLLAAGDALGRNKWQRARQNPHYSRPRSRWVVVTVTRGYCARRFESSMATATERCLPPVQPTASVA
ncbi:hypothetical protein D3C73_1130210 [compost metagenome]